MSVCSRCEGKYRRPYATGIVIDSIVRIVAAIWQGCRDFESRSGLEGFVVVEVLLYVHRNRRLIRDGSPGRPPRLSRSS